MLPDALRAPLTRSVDMAARLKQGLARLAVGRSATASLKSQIDSFAPAAATSPFRGLNSVRVKLGSAARSAQARLLPLRSLQELPKTRRATGEVVVIGNGYGARSAWQAAERLRFLYPNLRIK